MKKQIAKSMSFVAIFSTLFILPALAYTATLHLSLDSPSSHATYFKNTVTSNAPKSFIDLIQVNMTLSEEATDVVVYDGQNFKDDFSTDTISITYSGKRLPSGRYVDFGLGIVRYIPELNQEPDIKEKYLTFDYVNPQEKSDIPPAMTRDEIEDRGLSIAAAFSDIPDEYRCFVKYEILEELDSTLDYLAIVEKLQLSFGDTMPVYFMDNAKNSLIAVKRDIDGNNYKYSFEKSEDAKWDYIGVEIKSVDENSFDK